MASSSYIFIPNLVWTKCQLSSPAFPIWGTNEKVHVKASSTPKSTIYPGQVTMETLYTT